MKYNELIEQYMGEAKGEEKFQPYVRDILKSLTGKHAAEYTLTPKKDRDKYLRKTFDILQSQLELPAGKGHTTIKDVIIDKLESRWLSDPFFEPSDYVKTSKP